MFLGGSLPSPQRQGMFYMDEVWRSYWSIQSANILTFQKFIDPMSSICLVLSSIEIKSRPTKPVKRITSKTPFLYFTAVTVPHSKAEQYVWLSKVMPAQTIKPSLLQWLISRTVEDR
ncbi:hypothetical protein TNCV_1411191 [Trichonephila clavipes]|nr:hypothetical protein TNCV_1411191 [Trichonephila clavipes]